MLLLKDILELDQRFRNNLINSIGGFKSVALIGTKSKDGVNNLAIFNSIVHIGSSPALIGFIVRPDSVERHTLSNCIETGYYTINHVNAAIFKSAHQTSARYPAEISEFDAVHLKPEFKANFFAPFVQESKIQLAVKFKECVPLSINSTKLIIGEIQMIVCPDEFIAVDGFVDLEKAGSLTGSGLDAYFSTKRLARLSYAKPDKDLLVID